VGIDIGKARLDWAVFGAKGIVLQTTHTIAGIKTALRLFKALPDGNSNQVIFCMEHTGIDNAHLLELLYKLHLPICLESSLEIKKAGGLQRGKTDDAQPIAEYAYRFPDQLRLGEPPRQVVEQRALLSATRQRLMLVHNQLAGRLAEQQNFINPTLQKQLQKSCKAALTALQKAIDIAIDQRIAGDEHLKELFARMTSVPGIGVATATEVMIATNEDHHPTKKDGLSGRCGSF